MVPLKCHTQYICISLSFLIYFTIRFIEILRYNISMNGCLRVYTISFYENTISLCVSGIWAYNKFALADSYVHTEGLCAQLLLHH